LFRNLFIYLPVGWSFLLASFSVGDIQNGPTSPYFERSQLLMCGSEVFFPFLDSHEDLEMPHCFDEMPNASMKWFLCF
jgi:hypothetical protein